MKSTPETLKAVMDTVRLDAALTPIKNQYGTTTFCNLNAYRVIQALGYNLFYNYDSERVMLANEMIAFMEERPEKFSKFYSHEMAHDLAGKGYLIYAAKEGEIHGHIAPVYPADKMLSSGKWMCQVPYVSNIGEENKIMGVNWAFRTEPNYYLVI